MLQLVAEFEFIDADSDGITDELINVQIRLQEFQLMKMVVATSQLDTDGDGVTDDIDQDNNTRKSNR